MVDFCIKNLERRKCGAKGANGRSFAIIAAREVDFLIFEELLVLRGKGNIGVSNVSNITLDGLFLGYRLDASVEEFEGV
ncbi:MAG: hypothetical protein QMC89_04330 [Candidatus Hodarchaeaceae archaeon]|nr:hypothetical protein [Candidatus Hodarchaeaceae archaeon]